MKRAFILPLLIATKALAITNPAEPGSTYDGTSDIAVFKMLIFSCFQHCNERYFESMHVDEVSPEQVPERGRVPAILMPNGVPIESIQQVREPEIPNHYKYPHLKQGTEVLQFKSNLRRTSEGFETTLRFTAALIDGSYYLLRPVWVESKSEQAGAGQPATRPEAKSEGSDKPQPEAEERSR